MDLVAIDVIGAEAAKTSIDLDHDRLARQAGTIGSRSHPAIHLGGDDHLIALREVLDRSAEDLLAIPERIAVRRVEEIDTGFERTLDKRAALLLAEAPGMITAVAATIAHAAEANPRHLQAGAAELGVLHPLPLDAKRQG